MPKTKVLVVDDSALMRKLLTDLIHEDPTLEVVGTANDPYSAWDKIKVLNPDILTLDVEMPKMDGLTFLEKLMANRPLPVVMISSLTQSNCETTFRAMELGAVDFVTKPKLDLSKGTIELGDEITAKIRAASHARPRIRKAPPPRIQAPTPNRLRTTHQFIALGASTGGTEALAEVLGAFPPDAPGSVAVIHMPEGFTKSYAARLDRNCAIQVREAQDGDRVLPGHALIAPGDKHTEVVRSGAITSVRVYSGERVSRHRPSVDVLFNSCARQLGANAVGAIFTGMGDDGARGLLAMRKAGARTIAQDEATCVVFGMPKEAISMGAAEEVLPLNRIADRLVSLAACS
jgi:two-component system, chemotaxis family, protein-glutamate methylesterase/glutaminase